MPKTYTCAGQTKTAAEWAKELGISRCAFYQRVDDFENPDRIFMIGYLRKPQRKNQSHGHSGTPTYNSWCEMLKRCNNPNSKKWPRYGGRGITVCAEWYLFKNFYADMGERPKGTTLDRKDNDGNYTKGNCRWATPQQQGLNTSKTIFLLVKGKRLNMQEAAAIYGVSMSCLRQRLHRQRRGEYNYGLAEIS
jgi:hypothetical protein